MALVTEPDVIIVGSGPAGVSAAWPLVEAGHSVAMLDAAEKAAPDPPDGDIETFRRRDDTWRHAFGDDFTGLGFGDEQSPKFATRIGRAVLSANTERPAIEAQNFTATRSIAAGGLSKLWGAFVTVFDERDLRAFPIGPSDLADSYRAIAARIGISGADDDLGPFHGSNLPLQAPDWLLPIGRSLMTRYQNGKKTENFQLGLARNAVLTRGLEGRSACNKCGLCLYGCARGAIYDSAQDLVPLSKRANFRYHAASHVIGLRPNGGRGPGVEIRHAGEPQILNAKALVLAAGTINSSALALGAAGWAGKSIRLLANPAAAIAFLVPSFLAQPLSGSGFSLGQLSYRLELGATDYATGVVYTADMLPFSALASHIPFSRHAALQLSQVLATAIVIATCYVSGRFSANHLTLGAELDGSALHIAGDITPQARRHLGAAVKLLSRAMRRLGAFAIPGSFSLLNPGADGHLAGTLPMQADGHDLTTTRDGELRPWKNIFVVDGACLSDLPAKHCTFTIMANADRIGRVLANRLATI